MAKKARKWDDIDDALLELHSLDDFQVRLKKATSEKEKTVYDSPSYWRSTEAKILFGPKPDETVEDALDRKIETLDKVMNEPNGYKLIVPGNGDPDGHYTDHERTTLKQKAMHIRLAYRLALESMESGGRSWGECCEEAAATLANIGISMGSR